MRKDKSRAAERRRRAPDSVVTYGPKRCGYCGNVLVRAKRGPEPTFCSGRCRVASFRARARTAAGRQADEPAASMPRERRMGKRANLIARRALRGTV